MYIPSLESILHEYRGNFSRIMPFDLHGKRLCYIDLSSANTALTPDIISDTHRFSAYISAYTHSRRSDLAIGKYGEDRGIYKKSSHFTPKGEEPRTVHLGVDLWVEEGTSVHAPLSGVIHSFADNNAYGDYGPALILEHEIKGVVFYTLYGHLSRRSLSGKRAGQPVSAGDSFAFLGSPEENGQWPPHLHFQVIRDLGQWKGDFPGVAKYSEKDRWLERCPDPSPILGIPAREITHAP